MYTTVTSSVAKNKLDQILADIERTGESVTITRHGRPVAKLVPVATSPRVFGQPPHLQVPADFDAPLPEEALAGWDSGRCPRPIRHSTPP
ncbi:type II toxin-antitoxin system Phd/YefM family antitoxin [Mycobacterium sp. C31M]